MEEFFNITINKLKSIGSNITESQNIRRRYKKGVKGEPKIEGMQQNRILGPS